MTVQSLFNGRLIMAPMSRGTDLPFRRLACEWGARVCVGEMAYAHKVVSGHRGELALLRRHENERVFGVQLAGKRPEVMAEALGSRRIAAPISSTSTWAARSMMPYVAASARRCCVVPRGWRSWSRR